MIVTAILGPMFSSKSTHLFFNLEKYIIANKKIALVRPKIDTREYFSHSVVDTKLNLLVEENKLSVLYTNDLKNKDFSFFDAVFIDEFFLIKNNLNMLKKHSDKDIHFYFAGLIADSDSVIWPEVETILPYVDKIIKLQGVCTGCGSLNGNYSYHNGTKENRIQIGDESEYECLCHACFFKRLEN